MSAIVCPHCGGVLFRTSPGGSGEAARDESPASAGGDEIRVTYEGGKWKIECPRHGWHGARAWAAKGEMPAVVKCTSSNADGSWCDVKLPLEVAKRRAGVSP